MHVRPQPRRHRRGRIVATVALAATTLVTSAAPAAATAPSQTWQESVDLSIEYWGVDAASDGDVVLGGWEQPGGGETNGLIRRVDSAGDTVWSATIGPTGTADWVEAVAVADDGSVYVTGRTRGDIGGRSGGTDFDPFVARYTSGGAQVWTDQFGPNGVNNDDTGEAITVGPDGSVYVAGSGNGVGIGGGGNLDAWVRKYTATGAVLFTVEFGTADNEVVNDIAVDTSGTVYVVGDVSAPSSGATEGFITRLTSGGIVLGTDTVSGASTAKATSVAAHPGGGAVVGGWIAGATSSTGYLQRYGSSTFETMPPELNIFDVDVSAGGDIVAMGIPSDATFEEGVVAGITAGGAVDWEVDLPSSNGGRVAATSDGGILTWGSNVLSAPGQLTRFGGSGGGGGGSFTDVPAGAFYAEAVEWLKAEGITTGTSPTTYSPDDTVTRGQMAAFLHRLAGTPGGSPPAGFTDVPAGAFYEDAVAWLKAEGITTGTSSTTYSPNDTVTRGQMAAFLHRLAGEPAGSPPHGFDDVPDGAFYADAVAWLKDQGITTGTSSTTYSPNDEVTRGQMAAFLFRMATDSDWDYPGD